jgi:hypothetical protein
LEEAVTIPTADEQIRFLVNLQRLLDEGLFVASYKFALLLSLADLSIEKGDDSGSPLTLTTDAIAEKFIQYYWRQAVPYPAAHNTSVLKQNTGKQAAVINLIGTARAKHGESLALVMKQHALWKKLRRKISNKVSDMPLWKLQTVGRETLDFLYQNAETGGTIELRSGVAYCFRKFHPLIADLVRGAWLRYVRQQNIESLGETADLNQFLFGSERAALAVVRPVLIDIQHGRCFYCNKSLSPLSTHVDHFIAWSRYPIDLGHNFVLADNRCNSQKCDRLPAYDHLSAWTERNVQKLQGDKPSEPTVFRLIHHAHTAAAEFLDDAVVRDRRVDHDDEVYKGCLMIGPKKLSVNFG